MSSGNMRAQLSLLFTDKELYNNFIVPSKNNRRLHSIILKCLTAYYYKPEVRNMIEGVELRDDTEDTVHATSQQESINNIRNLLTMQGFLSKELENTLEDGVDEFTDILDHVNQTAEEYGVMKSTNNEYGTRTFKLLTMKEPESHTPNEKPQYEEVVVPDNFAETISEMSNIVQLMRSSGMLNQLEQEAKAQQTTNTSEEILDEEITEPKKPTVKRGRKPATKPVVEVEEETPVVKEEPKHTIGEAADSLNELLDSL